MRVDNRRSDCVPIILQGRLAGDKLLSADSILGQHLAMDLAWTNSPSIIPGGVAGPDGPDVSSRTPGFLIMYIKVNNF